MNLPDPDDAEQLLVHADWLTQQGDPRGALIVVQHARLAQPANSHLEYEEQRILRAYPELVPDVPGTLTWERGWVRGAVVTSSVLPALVEHPSARYLRDLVVTTRDYRDPLFTLDAKPPPLERLAIKDRSNARDRAPYHALAYPRLRHFAIEGAAFDIGTFDIPQIETLLLRVEHSASADALCVAALARLVSLEVWFAPDLIAPLFARADLPALRHVRFGAAASDLAGSPLAAQLETIGVRDGGPFAPWLP